MDAATHETGLDLGPWRLTPADRALVEGKHRANRLAFAIMLLFFRERGRFPRATDAIDAPIDVPVPADIGASLIGDLAERTMERQRAEIRALFAFREATVDDAEALGAWLRDHAVAQTRDLDRLVAALEERCRVLSIEPPTPDRVERIARVAVRAYEERFAATIYARLSKATCERLDALLRPAAGTGAGVDDAEIAAGEALTAESSVYVDHSGYPTPVGFMARRKPASPEKRGTKFYRLIVFLRALGSDRKCPIYNGRR